MKSKHKSKDWWTNNLSIIMSTSNTATLGTLLNMNTTQVYQIRTVAKKKYPHLLAQFVNCGSGGRPLNLQIDEIDSWDHPELKQELVYKHLLNKVSNYSIIILPTTTHEYKIQIKT